MLPFYRICRDEAEGEENTLFGPARFSTWLLWVNNSLKSYLWNKKKAGYQFRKDIQP